MKKERISHHGFEVEATYFDRLEQQLLPDQQAASPSGHQVPEGYFEALEQKLLPDATPQTPSKVYRLWAPVLAVAAGLALVLWLSVPSDMPANSFAALSDEEITDYIAAEEGITFAELIDQAAEVNLSHINEVLPQEELEQYLLDETDLDQIYTQ
jgi:hypothetical protein